MYELIILLAGLFALFLVPPTRRNKKYRFYDYANFLLWLLIFATIAFRAENVGADTSNYIHKYINIKGQSSYSEYGGTAAIEPLFYYINKLLSFVFGSWAQCIIVFEAIAVVAVYAQTFKRYSTNAIFSILGFLALGLYLSSLCLLRQFLAMSICVYSLKYVINKNIWKFLVCVFAATAIHYTAIFWIVVYFACNSFNKNNNLKFVIYIFFSIVGYFTVDMFQEATSGLFDRWTNYSETEFADSGYISFTIFTLITILVFIYRKSIIAKYPYANVMININYLNMILWAMRLVTRNTERISFYFTIAPILLVPVLCQVISKKYGKVEGTLFKIVIVVSMMALFLVKATKDKSLYPYEFMNF